MRSGSRDWRFRRSKDGAKKGDVAKFAKKQCTLVAAEGRGAQSAEEPAAKKAKTQSELKAAELFGSGALEDV